jgi:hypothetical protein
MLPRPYRGLQTLCKAPLELNNCAETDISLDELNYLAAKIEALDANEREVFEAVLEAEWHCGSVADIINITENISNFELQPAFNEEQYGAKLR